MKTEKGVVCNGCRTGLPEEHPVSKFKVKAGGAELSLHLCETCVPKYEAKKGLEAVPASPVEDTN